MMKSILSLVHAVSTCNNVITTSYRTLNWLQHVYCATTHIKHCSDTSCPCDAACFSQYMHILYLTFTDVYYAIYNSLSHACFAVCVLTCGAPVVDKVEARRNHLDAFELLSHVPRVVVDAELRFRRDVQ